MFSFCKKWKGSCTCFLDKFLNKDWSECCKGFFIAGITPEQLDTIFLEESKL